MELRILRYFLTVAHEGNITKAAELLHITQPTLSRQLMELEEELATTLFIRGKRQITLTDSGILFQQRAKEIVLLADKTQQEFAQQNGMIGGVVSIGCVETSASRLLPEMLEKFSDQYPCVQYDLYSADGDDIRDKLDRGQADIGILLEPIETAKYDYIRLPYEESWGVLMRKSDALAQSVTIELQDIANLPLILPRRSIVQGKIASWLGVAEEQLHVFATHNLLTNAALLVERGLGYVICVSGAHDIRRNSNLCFVPFSPKRTTGHVLAWKKNRVFNQATTIFVEQIKNAYRA